jgi:hypothetical protein
MGKNIICNHYDKRTEECLYDGKTCPNDNSSKCCYNCDEHDTCNYACPLGTVVSDELYEVINSYGGIQDMIVFEQKEDYFALNCILCQHTFMTTDNLIFLEPSKVIKKYTKHLERCDHFNANS